MIKKVALVAFVCLIIGIIGTVMFGDGIFAVGSKVQVDEERHVEAEEVSQLKMSLDVGNIKMTESEDEDIHIYLTGEYAKSARSDLRFDVEQNGDKLTIDAGKKQEFGFSIGSLVNFGDTGKLSLIVELPVKQYKQMEVTTNVGDLKIDKVKSDEFEAKVNVGDVTISELIATSSSVELNVGDVVVRDVSGKMEVVTNTGGIDVSFLELTEDVFFKSNVGDIKANFQKQPENVVLDLKSNVGDVTVDGFEGISNEPGKNYYVELGKGSAPRIELKTDVGDIDVLVD